MEFEYDITLGSDSKSIAKAHYFIQHFGYLMGKSDKYGLHHGVHYYLVNMDP